MPRCQPLDTCCCCVALRLGSLLIAYMDLLVTILILWDLRTLPEDLNYIRVKPGTSVVRELLKNINVSTTRTSGRLGDYVMIASYILNAFRVVFIVALLFGLHTNKRGPMVPYLIYNVIHMVGFVTLIIVGVAVVFTNDKFTENTLWIVWSATIFCIIAVLLPIIYFWVVILSQYYTMKNNEQNVRRASSTPPTGQRPRRTKSGTLVLEMPPDSTSFPRL